MNRLERFRGELDKAPPGLAKLGRFMVLTGDIYGELIGKYGEELFYRHIGDVAGVLRDAARGHMAGCIQCAGCDTWVPALTGRATPLCHYCYAKANREPPEREEQLALW